MIIKNNGNILFKSVGVDPTQKLCHRCFNNDPKKFYTFKDYNNVKIIYCMNCIMLGRIDNMTPLKAIDIIPEQEQVEYELSFEFSREQKEASNKMLEAFKKRENLLLHAVTGAGKTEITFETIQYARQNGYTVGFVAPRIDVVKEIYNRIKDAFQTMRIDLKYQGVKVEHSHQCVVCTVNQLFNYFYHFDVLIIDETDAFPLISDPLLFKAITTSCKESSSIIMLTATPNEKMTRYIPVKEKILIQKRYHGHPLAVPELFYINEMARIKKMKVSKKLLNIIETVIHHNRKVLIFVPEIKYIQLLETILQQRFNHVASVFSSDPLRFKKVEQLRAGEIKILVTSTILERGVTLSNLDVIIIGAERFNVSALVQMCGRVGRKVSDPVGNIYIFTGHNTLAIQRMYHMIHSFNQGGIN